MATRIFYFTGTGNSLFVARELAAKLGGAQLVPMTQVVNGGTVPDDADCVGLVFPVYMFGPPLLVCDFIRRVQLKPSTYIFAVATMGGWAARTMPILRDALKERSLNLSYSALITLPGNYTPFYGAIPVEKQQAQFKAATRQVDTIAAAVISQSQKAPATNLPLINHLFSWFYGMGIAKVPEADRNFSVDDTCTKCGICAQVCPVKNITLVDGRPQWQHRCQQCLACLQYCPAEAIQHGKKTRGRKRYRHPQCSVANLRAQSDAK